MRYVEVLSYGRCWINANYHDGYGYMVFVTEYDLSAPDWYRFRPDDWIRWTFSQRTDGQP